MNFTLLITALLTAITLVVAAYVVAKPDRTKVLREG